MGRARLEKRIRRFVMAPSLSASGHPRHKQCWVKVNAPVDCGVADLVEALSSFPMLQTRESCECLGEECAWVGFSYGQLWTEMADFSFAYFCPELFRRVGDDAAQRIKNGRPLILGDSDCGEKSGHLEQFTQSPSPSDSRCRAYDLDGCFLGVLRFNPERGQWQPEKVLI